MLPKEMLVQAGAINVEITTVSQPRDLGLPTGKRPFQEHLSGNHEQAGKRYSETHFSRLPTVSWRPGMDTPRDHHHSPRNHRNKH